MSVSESIAKCLASLFTTLHSETVDWQRAHRDDLAALRREEAVSEQALRQDLALLAVRFQEEHRRLQLEEDRSTRSFSEFLDSLDAMRARLLSYYPALPRPLAVLIHHRALVLLTAAWHGPTARERLKRQMQFTDLMLAITEDLAALAHDGEANRLPEKTLTMIEKERPRSVG